MSLISDLVESSRACGVLSSHLVVTQRFRALNTNSTMSVSLKNKQTNNKASLQNPFITFRNKQLFHSSVRLSIVSTVCYIVRNGNMTENWCIINCINCTKSKWMEWLWSEQRGSLAQIRQPWTDGCQWQNWFPVCCPHVAWRWSSPGLSTSVCMPRFHYHVTCWDKSI